MILPVYLDALPNGVKVWCSNCEDFFGWWPDEETAENTLALMNLLEAGPDGLRHVCLKCKKQKARAPTP